MVRKLPSSFLVVKFGFIDIFSIHFTTLSLLVDLRFDHSSLIVILLFVACETSDAAAIV